MMFFPAPLCTSDLSRSPDKNSPKVFSGMVYDDAEVLYSEIRKSGDSLFETAAKVLMPSSVPLASLSDTLYSISPSISPDLNAFKNGAEIVGLNTTFFPRREIVKVSKDAFKDDEGFVVQGGKDESGKEAYVVMEALEGAGVARPLAASAAKGIVDTGVSGESIHHYYHFIKRNVVADGCVRVCVPSTSGWRRILRA